MLGTGRAGGIKWSGVQVTLLIFGGDPGGHFCGGLAVE
jgi:hypothetical protein